MLKNAYLLAKIGGGTAENEQHFAKNWQLLGPWPRTAPLAKGHGKGGSAAPVSDARRDDIRDPELADP